MGACVLAADERGESSAELNSSEGPDAREVGQIGQVFRDRHRFLAPSTRPISEGRGASPGLLGCGWWWSQCRLARGAECARRERHVIATALRLPRHRTKKEVFTRCGEILCVNRDWYV